MNSEDLKNWASDYNRKHYHPKDVNAFIEQIKKYSNSNFHPTNLHPTQSTHHPTTQEWVNQYIHTVESRPYVWQLKHSYRIRSHEYPNWDEFITSSWEDLQRKYNKLENREHDYHKKIKQ